MSEEDYVESEDKWEKEMLMSYKGYEIIFEWCMEDPTLSAPKTKKVIKSIDDNIRNKL